MRRAAACAALCALAVMACAPAQQPVTFTDSWPASPRAYTDATRDWTRHARLRRGFDDLIQVHATFKAPEWRAAYVSERARRERLPPDEHGKLLASEQKDAGEYFDVQLIVATHDQRENDLQKGDRSVWRIALIDDRNNQITPISIKRDRRPDEIIRAYFPAMNDFTEAYLARFPKDVALLRKDASRFTLRLSSARGAVEIVWPSAR